MEGGDRLPRVARAVLAGLIAAAAVAVGRRSGLLDGVAGLVLAVVLLGALPVSRELSRRIVLVGVIVLGWVPVLWWLHLPVGDWGRVTIGLSALAAGLASWVVAGASPAARLRRLVPRAGVTDLLPFGAAGVMAVIVARWSFGTTSVGALATLSRGWDNSAHFFMTSTIRRTGAVLARLGDAPGGEEWAYRNYPQGFHTVSATIIELLHGPDLGTPESELVGYLNSLAIVSVVAVLVVVAGLTALPRLRTRFWTALPLAVFLAAVVVLGPGGSAMPDGFPNFVIALALTAVAPMLVVMLVRLHSPTVLLALGGVAVGIAHTWVLLLVLLVPVVVAMSLPWRRTRWHGTRRQWLVTGTIAAATLGGVGYAGSLVASESVDDVLSAVGGIQAPPGAQVAFFAGAAVAASIMAWSVLRVRRVRPPAALRVAVMGAAPLLGGAAAIAIAVVQIDATGGLTATSSVGHVSYYFFKFEIGLVVLSAAVLVTAVAVAAPYVASARTSRSAALGAVCLSLATTQVFGLTVPHLVDAGIGSPAPALPRQQDWAAASNTQPAEVLALLAAARAYDPALGRAMYVTPMAESGLVGISAAQWYYALTGTWTAEGNAATLALLDEDTIADAALAVLGAEPGTNVVVRPEAYDEVVELAARHGWDGRVTTS